MVEHANESGAGQKVKEPEAKEGSSHAETKMQRKIKDKMVVSATVNK